MRLEVETDAAGRRTRLDVVDVATSKRMREMQDGLPGTREWYNQALPWYTQDAPRGSRRRFRATKKRKKARALRRKRDAGNAGTRERGRPFTEDDARAFTRAGRRSGGRGCGHDARAGGYRRGHVRRRHSRAAAERAGDETRRRRRTTRADERRAVAEDPLASASLEVVSALENLARRNSHLTDRVEMLLEMIENKGFGGSR